MARCEPPPPTLGAWLPAGLVDVIELADKAVVTPCMHEFCEPCISRWLGHHKRLCPLCKARVGSGAQARGADPGSLH